MKRRNLLISLCIAILTLCITIVGCNSVPPTLSLNKSSLSMIEGESVNLVATVENYDGDLSWSSSSTDVATVDENGKVHGVKPGSAIITVSADEVTATCSVTVMKDETFPVITVDYEQVDLYVNGTFAITAKISRNKAPFQAQLTFTSNDESIATVTQQGVITAISTGTAYVSVSTEFEGHLIEKIITVNVNVDLDVALEVSSLKLATGSVLKDDNVGEQELNLTISEKGTLLTDKEVVWESENTEVATVSSNGYQATITAVDKGITNVSATFEHNGATVVYFISVECYVPYYTVEADVFVDASKFTNTDTTVELSVDGVESSLVSFAQYNGQELTVNVGDNGLIIPIETLKTGVKELKVEADKTGYIANVVYATKVLANKEDVLAFATSYNTHAATDYYVLSSDIDMENTNVTTYTGSTWNIGTIWTATFDGRGHALKNIAYTHGLFTSVGSSGVIRNLALLGAKKAINGGGLIANEFSGTLEDCYIQGVIETNTNQYDQGGLIGATRASAVIRNVVAMVEYTAKMDMQNALFGSGVIATSVAGNMTVRNVVAISKTAPNICFGRTLTNVQNTYLYQGVVELLNDNKFDKSSFVGYWTDVEGLPLMDSVKSTIDYQVNITNTLTSLTNGDKVVADNPSAEFKLKTAVEGVKVMPDGTVMIDESVDAGTEIIVEACIMGTPVTEKIFKTVKAVATNAKYYVDLSKNFEIDLADMDESLTDANAVELFIVDGVTLTYTVSGSKLVVDSSSTAGMTTGLNKLGTIILNTGVAYKINVNVATMLLSDKDDVIEFAKQYGTIAKVTTNLILMTDDIDMENTNVTTLTGSTWTIATMWGATFDGQGNVLRNIAYTHGLFTSVTSSGIIRNLTVLNAQKATNGGGLIANEFSGKLEDCFIQGTITSNTNKHDQGGLVHATRASAVIRNVVVVVEYTEYAETQNALFGSGKDATTVATNMTVTNVVAISKTAPNACYGRTLTNATNYGVYSSVAQFVADTEFDKSSFTGVWTDTTKLPLMDGATDGLTANITTTAQKVMTGDAITADNVLAEFGVETTVEGISITAGGVLNISTTVPADTEFKVILTIFGKKVAEKTFKTDYAVDKTAQVFNVGVKNTDNAIDVAKLDASLTAEDVTALAIVGGENVSFTKDGTKLLIASSALSELAMGKTTVIVSANGTKYVTTLNVATMFINNKADLITFYTNQYSNVAGELYVLTTDIDMAGDESLVMESIYTYRESGLSYAWVATFDGQGHVISNATYQNAFFPQVNTGGLIKNLGLINPTDKHTPGAFKYSGLLTWRLLNAGAIENVYVKASGLSSEKTGGIAGANGPAASGHSSSISNSVIIVENVEGVTTGGTVTATSTQSCGKFVNLFTVSASRSSIGKTSPSAVLSNNVAYGTIAELNTAGVAGTTLATTGSVWSVVEGNLYFGNTLVG